MLRKPFKTRCLHLTSVTPRFRAASTIAMLGASTGASEISFCEPKTGCFREG